MPSLFDFFNFQNDQVVGRGFDPAWEEACRKLQQVNKTNVLEIGDQLHVTSLIKDFLEKYYLKFVNEALIDPKPGSEEEEGLVDEIKQNIKFFRRWINRMTKDIKKWPSDWSSILLVLENLKNSESLEDAQTYTRTYTRVPLAQNNADQLQGFDRVFIRLQNSLEMLAEEIIDAHDAIV